MKYTLTIVGCFVFTVIVSVSIGMYSFSSGYRVGLFENKMEIYNKCTQVIDGQTDEIYFDGARWLKAKKVEGKVVLWFESK